MTRLSIIFGTRPEAIKLCPLILALKAHPAFEPDVCVTGQHREMLDQVLRVSDVVPDVDLGLMEEDQTLSSFTARAVRALHEYLSRQRPDLIIVQGDTTTTFCAALASFYRYILRGTSLPATHNPFGDGKASKRIINFIIHFI
jgi:UDP-N-acetylglucosamine 2-epimerase (non-hydrolysing)